jgi:hypothetical protein
VSEWIKFVEVDLHDGRKTRVWAVLTLDGRAHLGDIVWYTSWRKYCFMPGKAVFDTNCLREVADFLDIQTTAHKSRRKAIDYINGDPADNRIENLRIVTLKENT